MPSFAEYLPVPTSAPTFAAFDAWLSDASEWAAGRAGPGWPEACARGAMYGFVFRSPTAAADVLCGALAPSRDSAGRAFPLAVAAPLHASTELLRRPELLPFVLEDSWARLTEACADLISGRLLDATALPELAERPVEPVAEAAQVYDEWVSSLELAELWALLGPAMTDPALPLRVLLETLTPARGVERPRTTLALRLPLGRAGGAALCAWLDSCVAGLAGRQRSPASFGRTTARTAPHC